MNEKTTTDLIKHTECNISSLQDIINACKKDTEYQWESDRQRLDWISEAASHLWLNNSITLKDIKEASKAPKDLTIRELYKQPNRI